MAKYKKEIPLFPDEAQKNTQGPVECLGMTFSNDEERRKYFLDKLREGLEELHAKFGNVSFTTVDDAVAKMKSIEKWPMGEEERLRVLAGRMGCNESSKDLLQMWKDEVGFPHGEMEDMLALSDPPYYTACPNPFIGDFIKYYCKPYDPNTDNFKREPFAADITEGKRDPIYEHYSYHTKVPHRAIAAYIAHYTEPGDVVLDAFSGSGMTGVAGKFLAQSGSNKKNVGERHVILSDLSPYATFIGHHFNRFVPFKDLTSEFEKVAKDFSWIYQTKHIDGSLKPVNYYVWSDLFVCPECSGEIIFFKEFVNQITGKVNEKGYCPTCNVEISKNSLVKSWTMLYDDLLQRSVKVLRQRIVLVKYLVGSSQYEKIPDDYDFEVLKKVQSISIPSKVPIFPLPAGDNTNQPIRSHCITHSHMFFTKRNLIALYALWEVAEKERDTFWLFEILDAFRVWTKRSIFLTTAWKQGGTGAFKPSTTGILYIPSISGERNIFISFRERRRKALQFKKMLPLSNTPSVTNTSSTTDLLGIPANSIDYVFVDPPFGGNLMYSELNMIFEPWLKILTNSRSEAICNSTQNKKIDFYTQQMTKAFSEVNRVLKPGRWITIEFHNSKNSIWNSIQESLQTAGLVIADVRTLDKKQGTFKQYTSVNIARQDLIISAYKPNGGLEQRFKLEAGTEEGVWDFISAHLKQLPIFVSKDGQAEIIAERQNYLLFDRMVAFHVQRGVTVPLSAAEFYAGLVRRFSERDGMYFLPEQVAEYDRKRMSVKEVLQLQLYVSDEASAIQWLKQQLTKKPQSFQEIHPQFLKEIAGWQKYEKPVELSSMLEQNFLRYDGRDEVPSQIHSYLSTNFKDLRNLPKDDPALSNKAKDRWYVPDPNKAGDLEKLREKALLREFDEYRNFAQKRLKIFRLEAVRAGFKKAFQERNYTIIIEVAHKIPEKILQEDPKLLMWYDQALTRTEG